MKAIVLFSGGQDSTTCLFWARERFAEVEAVSIVYGQRHVAEVDAARDICVNHAHVKHTVLDATALGVIASSALTDASKTLEASGGLVDTAMPQGLPTSFVPGRNMLFLALASSYAVAVGAKTIVTGVCETDYSGYPDCREAFIASMEATINLAMPSSVGPFSIEAPLMHLSKAETVAFARTLNGCWEAMAKTVTCYQGLRPGCGACAACALRARGFSEASIIDPAGGAA